MIQFLPLIGQVVDKLFPDPVQAANAKLEMMKMEQNGEFKEIDASLQRDIQQIALNKIEAGSDNIFKSGWRPFTAWVCAFGLAYSTIIYPILTWAAIVWNITPPPNLSTDVLMPILLGMLGLGGMRSFEKLKQLTK